MHVRSFFRGDVRVPLVEHFVPVASGGWVESE